MYNYYSSIGMFGVLICANCPYRLLHSYWAGLYTQQLSVNCVNCCVCWLLCKWCKGCVWDGAQQRRTGSPGY